MRTQQFLDIGMRQPAMRLERVVAPPKAWTRASVGAADWEVPLGDAARREIEALVELLHKDPLPRYLLSPDPYELSACQGVMAKIRDHLVDGIGLAVLDRLPLERMSREDATSVYWVLGQMLARPVATKWDGTMLYDVMDTGRKLSYGVRGSWTNTELYFHTDNAFGIVPPEFVSLFCLSPALEGGMSRFSSLYHVHNEMLKRHAGLLPRLYRPCYFDRQAEHAPDDPKVSWVSTFAYDGENLHARLAPGLVRRGYELMDERMDSELVEALAALEEIMSHPDVWVEFTIQKGQLQFLNNRECAHFRSQFRDAEEPERKRHMVRMWYRDAGRRSYNG